MFGCCHASREDEGRVGSATFPLTSRKVLHGVCVDARLAAFACGAHTRILVTAGGWQLAATIAEADEMEDDGSRPLVGPQ